MPEPPDAAAYAYDAAQTAQAQTRRNQSHQEALEQRIEALEAANADLRADFDALVVVVGEMISESRTTRFDSGSVINWGEVQRMVEGIRTDTVEAMDSYLGETRYPPL